MSSSRPEFRWRVDYWREQGSVFTSFRSGPDSRWEDLPQGDLPSFGVVRALIQHGVYTHTLQGMDNYWLIEDLRCYGMWNDPENRDWYPGRQQIAFTWPAPGLCTPLANPRPPSGVHTLRGVMLPDDLARKVGIL